MSRLSFGHSMKIYQAIQKAVLLADLRGDLAGAAATLRDALTIEESDENPVYRIQATLLLAELLDADGRPAEALPLLETLVTGKLRMPDENDLFEPELSRARQLFDRLSSANPGHG